MKAYLGPGPEPSSGQVGQRAWQGDGTEVEAQAQEMHLCLQGWARHQEERKPLQALLDHSWISKKGFKMRSK